MAAPVAGAAAEVAPAVLASTHPPRLRRGPPALPPGSPHLWLRTWAERTRDSDYSQVSHSPVREAAVLERLARWLVARRRPVVLAWAAVLVVGGGFEIGRAHV